MSKLKDKRYEIIKYALISHGIEFGDKIFISLWEAAGNINNAWGSIHFITKQKRDKIGKFYSDHKYVVDYWWLYELFPAIRHGIKDTDIELRKSYNNGAEYLILKQ